MRKAVDCEKLLQWCYREELPKSSVGGLTGWEKLILLGGKIDDTRIPDSSFPVALGSPHPDALLIDWRVRQLEDIVLPWDRFCHDIMGDLLPYAPADDSLLQRMQFQVGALVMLHARMGNRPTWDLGPVRLHRIISKNGKPMVNGATTARGCYAEGASCPLQLDPLGHEIAGARAEYLVWRWALTSLASASWDLVDHVPVEPQAAALPWKQDTEYKPRILHSLTAPKRFAKNSL